MIPFERQQQDTRNKFWTAKYQYTNCLRFGHYLPFINPVWPSQPASTHTNVFIVAECAVMFSVLVDRHLFFVRMCWFIKHSSTECAPVGITESKHVAMHQTVSMQIETQIVSMSWQYVHRPWSTENVLGCVSLCITPCVLIVFIA